jgi:type II secretory pathway component PulK
MRRDAGAALVMVLAVLFAVAAAGTALCLRTDETVRSTHAMRANLAARYAAQAGVESARAALARDPAHAGQTLRFDDFDVVVAVDPSLEGQREVRVTASGPRSHAVLACTLRLGPGLPVVTSWRER